MSIISNLNCPSFLVSSIFIGPLIVQLLIISQSCYLIDCLSLTELHSTLPSNQNNNRFKSRLSQEKSIRDIIRNLNHLHHQKLANNRDSIINSNNYHPQSIISNNYDLIVDNLDNDLNQQYLPGLPVTNDDYDDNLPENIPNYLIVKSPTINGINKRQDEVVMDIPLEYTSDIPYEFYPELWPSNQQRSPSLKVKVDDSDDLSSSDVLFQVLATKIDKLLKSESNEHNPQRKRVLVKRNHRSGLSGSPSNGGNHRGRFSRVAPHLSGKSHLRTNNKPITDSKHRLSSSSSSNHHGLSEDSKISSRKFGDKKKLKVNRIPLKSTLVGHQPVKGDSAKLVNGKAVHVAPMMIHSKVINSTVLNHKESDKIKKKLPFISKNFRKTEAVTHPSPTLNRKEKRDSNPVGLQSKSMKEFFNEIDLPKGHKSLAKRSISSRYPGDSIDFGLRQDDDSIDGYISNVNDSDDDDDSLDGNNGGRGEGYIESEINEGEFRSSSPMVLQSNPWLVDEATRTLMRSLTVKRRKRGNINNEDDQLTLIGLDDDDEEMKTSSTSTSTSIGDKYENVNSNSKNSNYDQLKINEIDESTTSSSGKPKLTEIIEFEDIDEIPARIVKKDGVTLTEGHPDIDQDENYKINNEKRSNQELITNGSQLKSTVVITSLVDGLDSDGDNETLLEEDFSEGLISIGDLDDLDKLNKSNSQLNSKNNDDDDDDDDDKNNGKPTDPIGLTYSSRSTSSPKSLTIVDVDQINGADDQIVNGSIDSDDQLLMETIRKGLYVNNKRKRSITGDPYFGKVGGQEPSSLSLPVSSLVAQEAEKFIDVDDKLERIEETLILEALDLIKGNLNGQTGQLVSKDDNFKGRIESRLNAAYDLEDMRLALTDLHKIMQKISNEDENNDEIIDRQLDNDNDHANEIDDGPDGQEVFLDSIDKLSISTKLDSEDDGQQNLKGDTGIRDKEIGHLKIFPSNLSPINNNHRHPTTINKNHHLNQIKTDECPAVRALTTDCSTIKDVVPFGSLEKIFGQACNWHEVCYSCGELFGLLSSDCDMGFLEQSRLACNDSASCETASRLILMPLKSRRTFYKQKVPSICYQQPCIENFLLRPRRKR